MLPAFTVIVPLHDKAPTIERCIHSIRAQQLPAQEIIVVNDACSDDSVERVRAMNISSLRLLHRDHPGPGGYAARNLGVKAANTDWVCFLDADDVWLPSHLATAGAIIQSQLAVNTVFLGRRVKQQGKPDRDITAPQARCYSFGELVSLFADRNLFHVNTLLVRRKAYLASGGFRSDRGWRRGGDTEFFLRLIRDAGPVFLSPSVTAVQDTNYSSIIGNIDTIARVHPVCDTAVETARVHTGEARALARLVNRKTLEWLRDMRGASVSDKLALLKKLSLRHMTARDLYRLARDFNRRAQ